MYAYMYVFINSFMSVCMYVCISTLPNSLVEAGAGGTNIFLMVCNIGFLILQLYAAALGFLILLLVCWLLTCQTLWLRPLWGVKK